MNDEAAEMAVQHAPRRHRVVIVGGGFGGLRAARALGRLPIDVTLIDRNNHHVFQPLLYQVATGVLSAGQVAPALRSFFRRQQSVQVLMGEVRGFDLARRVVRTWSGREVEVPYDTLIVAAGASHAYFGHDEWGAIAPGIKTLDDASRLRSRILGAFEMAEQSQPGRERDAWLTFVVVGGGPTGVELAGQLSVLSRRILRGEYRSIDSAKARVLLLDAGPSVLSMYSERLRAHAERDLRELGIEVQLGVKVVGVDEDGVTVESGGERRRISPRARRSGPRVSAPLRSRTRWRKPQAQSWTALDVCGCSPTSPFRATRRCSSSATWRRSPAFRASRPLPCNRAPTSRGSSRGASEESHCRLRFVTSIEGRWRQSVAGAPSAPCSALISGVSQLSLPGAPCTFCISLAGSIGSAPSGAGCGPRWRATAGSDSSASSVWLAKRTRRHRSMCCCALEDRQQVERRAPCPMHPIEVSDDLRQSGR